MLVKGAIGVREHDAEAWHEMLVCKNMSQLLYTRFTVSSLQWRHNERDCVSNHLRLHCLFNLLFRRRSKKTSKLRVTGFCEGIHRWLGNVSIWWRYHMCFIHILDKLVTWMHSWYYIKTKRSNTVSMLSRIFSTEASFEWCISLHLAEPVVYWLIIRMYFAKTTIMCIYDEYMYFRNMQSHPM